MKKVVCLLLAAAMALSLCACSGGQGGGSAEEVTITLPSDFMGEVTQESLDQTVKEEGFKSAVLNEDGTITLVMSKAKHTEIMQETKTTIRQNLEEMLTSGDYPSFVSIDSNDDYTEFTVTLNTDEVGLMESFSVLNFYMIGGMYHVFNGTSVDNISVKFVNEAGEVLQEANSSDMG